jgi:hypothetical protein
MRLREHATDRNTASSTRCSLRPAAGNPDVSAQGQPHPAALIQRANLAPRSFTPNDVIQLQRTLGNQAVCRLLISARSEQDQRAVQAQNTSVLRHSAVAGMDQTSSLKEEGTSAFSHSPNPPTLQADAGGGNRPKISLSRAGSVLQRYNIENLAQVNPLLLSTQQRRLFTRLRDFGHEVDYISGLSARAEAVAEDNPNLARDIRARRHTVRDSLATLRLYIEQIPDHILDLTAGENTQIVEAQAQTYADKITRDLIGIQEQVTVAAIPSRTFDEFKGDPRSLDEYKTGDSAAEAIPVVWYKRKEDYRDINLGRPDENGKTHFTFPKGPYLVAADDTEYDLSSDDPDPLRKGQTFKNNHLYNGRGVQQKIRATLTAYGFNHTGLDGDHIQDLGFGGKDEEDNIWPLDEKINRRPWTGWRGLYGINYRNKQHEGKTGTIASLAGKYFKIKDHMGPGEGAVPREGQRPQPESGLPD